MFNARATAKPDLRSRQSMTAYLSGHFRYDTMNSWNRATSYAHCVKLHRLGLSGQQRDAASDLIHADDATWQNVMRGLISDFTQSQGGEYTIGQNGRSGGYLVLYESHYKPSEHRSICRSCGQRNFCEPLDLAKLPATEAAIAEYMVRKGKHWTLAVNLADAEIATLPGTEEEKALLIRRWSADRVKWVSLSNACGVCRASGERGRFPYKGRELVTNCGRGIDADADFTDTDEWGMTQLRSRCELVMAFDAAVEEIRSALIAAIEQFEVVEEVIFTPRTVRVARERGVAA